MPASRRRLRTLGIGMVAVLAGAAGAAWIASASRPTPAEWAAGTPPDDAALAIMSFNVHEGGRPASETLDAIQQAAPEIVCLQELTAAFAADFERRLGARYPYRLFEPRRAVAGIGIASRRPLADARLLDLGLPTLPAAAAAIETGPGRIRIACVHLMPPHAGFRHGGDLLDRYRRNKALRLRQTDRLVEWLDAAALPAVILGDMNEWPGQAALARMAAAGFVDACGAPGARCGATWPGAIVPVPAAFRIDHIFGRGVEFSRMAVLHAGGSDHFPVAALVGTATTPHVKVASQ